MKEIENSYFGIKGEQSQPKTHIVSDPSKFVNELFIGNQFFMNESEESGRRLTQNFQKPKA